MAKKLATRSAQIPQLAEFVLNWNDWVTDSVSGQKATFGAPVASADLETISGLINGKNTTITFDAIPMPVGAVIVSGEVLVETAFAGPTATVSVGIAGATTAFVTTADMAATTRVAFTVTTNVELTCNNGQNIRLTVALGNTDATAGKVRIRVLYTIDGKADVNIGG